MMIVSLLATLVLKDPPHEKRPFKLSPERMAFTGRLDLHPDRARIEAYLRGRGVEPVYLTERPAFDIGSAVPLTVSAAAGISCP